MVELREYQKRIAHEGFQVVMQHDMLYLAMEVRTGKTFVALEICNRINDLYAESRKLEVLFVTKKKAIGSIEADAAALPIHFNMEIINYESLHKVTGIFDVVVCDEGQRIASFPKPCKAAKELRDMVDSSTRIIYLSGTPTPESFSQIYHQFWIHPRSPFREYVNFYKWANRYVTVTKKYVGHGNPVNDYSNANEAMIREKTDHLFITYTQEEAGFDSTVEEKILYVDMSDRTKGMVKRLMDDLVIEGKEHTILADTGVKLQQKCHQLWSGTIKFECGARQILDRTKAEFIAERFGKNKFAVFYKFIAEGEMLREQFPNHTDSPEEFNESEDKVFICQIQAGREGINLSTADFLIFLTVDFSATSYFQARDRMTVKGRTKANKIYWIFEKGGISQKIFKMVQSKKNYTSSHFAKDFLS